MIKLLSVVIVAGLFFAESNQQLLSQSVSAKLLGRPKENRCWTQWFDRDNPSGSGDWETLSSLLKAYPGKICSKPIGVEASTLSGVTAAAAGEVFHKYDTISGFVCRNKDQPDKKCNDYHVRFSCPRSFCDEGCWTQWFDRDDPCGSGDWETLSDLFKVNPGKICCKPTGVEARTLSGLTAAAAGDVIHKSDTTYGFICRNQDQPDKKLCNDYRVRFSCPRSFCDKVCWTKWYDRDNPSGTGDWESLKDQRKATPGQICKKPLQMEVVTTDTLTPASSTGESFHINSPTQGFACRNKDQKSRRCRDYKVRYGCPCKG